jgi:hypothetical protein
VLGYFEVEATLRAPGASRPITLPEELTVPARLSKAVLYIFLFYPAVTFYLSLILGSAVPYLADLFLIVALASFAILKPPQGIRIATFDLLFFLCLGFGVIFIALNYQYILDLIKAAEIRYILLIPIIYFLFRLALVRHAADLDVERILYRTLYVHAALVLVETVLLNLIGSDVILGRAAAVYPERDRVFEMIFGYVKPSGLFPGTANASIAAALLVLLCVHEKKINSLRFYVAIAALLLTFTLTGGVLVLLGYGILMASSGRRLHTRFFVVSIAAFVTYLAFYFQYEIALFRGRGIDFMEGDVLPTTGFENLELYFISIEDCFSRMGFLPHIFLEPSVESAIGEISEMYLLRVGVFYGYPMLVVLVVLMIWVLLRVFIERDQGRKILLLTVFLVMFASFHYPSINGVPLYILVPLLAWRIAAFKSEYARPGPSLVPAT